MFRFLFSALLVACLLFSACEEETDILVDNHTLEASQIDTLMSSEGVPFVITPQEYFQNLPDLTIDDLPSLGASLNMPTGWTFQAETLSEDLVLVTDGVAFIIQDELENSYQKIIE